MDERIRYLISNMAIPGSFNSAWGAEVWNKVSSPIKEYKSGPAFTSFTLDHSSRWKAHSQRRSCQYGPSASPPSASHQPNFYSHSTIAHMQGEDTIHMLSARVAHVLETCKKSWAFRQ